MATKERRSELRREGRICGGLDTLGFAVTYLRAEGMGDAEIREAVDAVLHVYMESEAWRSIKADFSTTAEASYLQTAFTERHVQDVHAMRAASDNFMGGIDDLHPHGEHFQGDWIAPTLLAAGMRLVTDEPGGHPRLVPIAESDAVPA
jgi:hypothetical protein